MTFNKIGVQMESEVCPISGESAREERINTFTHFIGFVLSVIGTFFLLGCCFLSESNDHWISCSVYCITLISLYLASTYYHACQYLNKKHVLKIIDHICIYLLIAGTYTPYTLGPLRDSGGWLLLTLVWSIALVGIFFKIFAVNRFKLFSTLSYLGMGWLIFTHFPELQRELSPTSLFWLIAGGVVYSAGTIFYLWERLSFSHGIWHLFVLGGSCCHYFSILAMI